MKLLALEAKTLERQVNPGKPEADDGKKKNEIGEIIVHKKENKRIWRTIKKD